MSLRKFFLLFVIGFVVGFITMMAVRAHAAERTPAEWNDRMATTIVVGYFAIKCPAVYPAVFMSPYKKSEIYNAIRAEADDAATDQGLPAGFFYPEIKSVMASLDPKWNAMEEYQRRVACGNIAVSYPQILQRVPTV
jgi:hypothetical protein